MKRKRTAAQKRATSRMIAANKRKRSKRRASDRPKKKKAGHRVSPKRRAAARKAARTRKRNRAYSAKNNGLSRTGKKRLRKALPAHKVGGHVDAYEKRKRARRRKAKRARDGEIKNGRFKRQSRRKRTSAAGPKGSFKSDRNKKQRRAARRRRALTASTRLRPKKRRAARRSPARRKSPARMVNKRTPAQLKAAAARRLERQYEKVQAKARAKRKRKGYVNRHGAPRMSAYDNPITVGGLLALMTLGAGGAAGAEIVDRLMASHALTASAAGAGVAGADPANVDQPGVGELYNTQSMSTPMDWKRWLAAVGATSVPLLLTIKWIPLPSAVKTGMRAAGVGAGIRTVTKGLIDLGAMLLGKTSFGERVFAPEIQSHKLEAAQAKETIALAPSSVQTYGRVFGRKPAQMPRKAGAAGGCCQECNVGRPCAKNPPAPPQTATEQTVNALGMGNAPAPTMPTAIRQEVAMPTWDPTARYAEYRR